MIAILKSPLALSLMDQMLVSAANLALNFWLIHLWAPATFGVFAIVTSISLSGLALHQALTGAQLPLMRARARGGGERSEVLATAWTVALAVALAVGVATWLGFVVLSGGEGRAAAVPAALFVGLHVCREHVRTYHFAEFEVSHALVNDAIHVVAVAAILLAATWLQVGIGTVLVLTALAVASAAAILTTVLRRPADFAVRLDRTVRGRLHELWREHSRWALMGASASEMQSRGHIVAVSTFFSVADLGIIQAALLLVRPVGVLVTAWGKVARPVMAQQFAEQRAADAIRYANLSALGFVVATLLYLAILWSAWPMLAEHVIPSAYHGLREVVPLWGLATLLALVRSVYSLQAQCVPLFREAFFASAAAMLVVAVGLGLAVPFGTATSTVLALSAGESAALTVLVLIVRREVGRRVKPTATATS